jgi:hypothetical protein
MNWFKGGFGAAAKLLRPWNRISQIRALPQFFGAVNAYRAAVSAEPLHCKLRTRISQLFRCGLGLACANWWSTYGLRDVRVVFGHTGTAETHLLERAIQSSGSETIHAVHGLSSGLNFATYSTAAVWRCGVDASWHERLGTCARDIFVPAELPLVEDRRGERDLLLTSLAHPMNIQYLLRGVAPEVELVEELCKLRQGRGLGLRWRRHPAAERLPARELEVLKDAARRLQISEVGNDCELFADVKMSRRVYCTASTTIVDVLRQGKVPIVVGDTRWASHLIFREVPLLSERMRGTETSDEDAGCDQRLKDVWRSLMPSAPLSPECYLHSGTKQ